jgi:hypothetical protein
MNIRTSALIGLALMAVALHPPPEAVAHVKLDSEQRIVPTHLALGEVPTAHITARPTFVDAAAAFATSVTSATAQPAETTVDATTINATSKYHGIYTNKTAAALAAMRSPPALMDANEFIFNRSTSALAALRRWPQHSDMTNALNSRATLTTNHSRLSPSLAKEVTLTRSTRPRESASNTGALVDRVYRRPAAD